MTGEADEALDARLNDELDVVNAASTGDVAPSRELTVKVTDGSGNLLGGVSGWTWGTAAGIAMTWVHADHRGTGLGSELLAAFEDEARTRGCATVLVTSFTFQAPGFYERAGYREIFRWEGVPTQGRDDVHFRKDL